MDSLGFIAFSSTYDLTLNKLTRPTGFFIIMSIKLVYGLKDGKVVRVTNVDVANGLACGCICLDCGEPLIAVANREGCLVRPHFKHYSSTNSGESVACTASQETAIHYLAKEIIEKNKYITLPPYRVRVNKHNGHGIRYHTIKEQLSIKFDHVENENNINTSQGFHDIKPDFIAHYGGRRLFIEIAVTHSSENNKIERVKELNVSTIEIDLSKFDRTAKEEELEIYLREKAPIKWLHHIKHEEYYQIALEKERKKEEAAAFYAEKEEQERKAREAKQRKEKIGTLQMEFHSNFESTILSGRYRGDLLSRIERFIQSEHGQSISCDSKESNIPYIDHKIDGLDDIYIYSNGYNNYKVECEFMGIPFEFSIGSQQPGYKLGCFIIANVFYQASKLLCDNLEKKVFNQEIEYKEKQRALEQEREEKRRREVLENLEKQRIEEQIRHDAEELQKKQNEKIKKLAEEKKLYEEKLVYTTIMNMYQDKKKQEQWNREHPIYPEEIIKKTKIQIPGFNNKRFIEIRRTLQNKGQLNKVLDDKMLTAVIIK